MIIIVISAVGDIKKKKVLETYFMTETYSKSFKKKNKESKLGM